MWKIERTVDERKKKKSDGMRRMVSGGMMVKMVACRRMGVEAAKAGGWAMRPAEWPAPTSLVLSTSSRTRCSFESDRFEWKFILLISNANIRL